MAEEQKKQKNKFTPKNLGKGGGKKPTNYYWIYAIVGVAIIGLQLFNFDGGSSNITEKEFEQMVNNKHVEYVVAVSYTHLTLPTIYSV